MESASFINVIGDLLKRQACHPEASSCCYVEQNGYKWVLF